MIYDKDYGRYIKREFATCKYSYIILVWNAPGYFVLFFVCFVFFQWKGLFTLHAILCWHLTSTSKKQQKCLSYGLEWPLMFYLCLWIDPAPISMKYIEQEGMFPLDSDTRSSVHHTKLVLPSTPNLVTYNWQRKSHFSMGRRL